MREFSFPTYSMQRAHLWVPDLRLSSILVSRFILNLRQVNYDLAHGSVTSVSLEMHFTIPTRSGRSLPHFIQPFAQPVHYSLEEEEEDTEHISAMDQDKKQYQELRVICNPEITRLTSGGDHGIGLSRVG